MKKLIVLALTLAISSASAKTIQIADLLDYLPQELIAKAERTDSYNGYKLMIEGDLVGSLLKEKCKLYIDMEKNDDVNYITVTVLRREFFSRPSLVPYTSAYTHGDSQGQVSLQEMTSGKKNIIRVSHYASGIESAIGIIEKDGGFEFGAFSYLDTPLNDPSHFTTRCRVK